MTSEGTARWAGVHNVLRYKDRAPPRRRAYNSTESAVSSSSVNSLSLSRDLTAREKLGRKDRLVQKSSAPASMPLTLSSRSLSPVIMQKRDQRVVGSSFNWRQSS